MIGDFLSGNVLVVLHRVSGLSPWTAAGIEPKDVDAGDHLVDWRGGRAGLRYVYEFTEAELECMAVETGFRVEESFFADGANRRSALYHIWAPA